MSASAEFEDILGDALTGTTATLVNHNISLDLTDIVTNNQSGNIKIALATNDTLSDRFELSDVKEITSADTYLRLDDDTNGSGFIEFETAVAGEWRNKYALQFAEAAGQWQDAVGGIDIRKALLWYDDGGSQYDTNQYRRHAIISCN